MKPGDLLFVYGTLRETGRFHYFLDGLELVDVAGVTGTMYSLGGNVPAVSLDGDGVVIGELYRMDTEVRINKIRALETGYECSHVDVTVEDGSTTKAWVYHVNDELWGMNVYNHPVVETGDWIRYPERRV